MSHNEAAQAEFFNVLVITHSQTAWNWDNAVEPHNIEFFYWKNGTIIDSSLNFPMVPVGYHERKDPKVDQ